MLAPLILVTNDDGVRAPGIRSARPNQRVLGALREWERELPPGLRR